MELEHLQYTGEGEDRGAELSREGARIRKILEAFCSSENAGVLANKIVVIAINLDVLLNEIKKNPEIHKNWDYKQGRSFSHNDGTEEVMLRDGLNFLQTLVPENLMFFKPLDNPENQARLFEWLGREVEQANRLIKLLKERGSISGKYLVNDPNVILEPINKAAKEKSEKEKNGTVDEPNEWVN